ncbi:MAG: hypothetical protein A2506_00015 [Elusimicrobia bacterium RIFOXYD12_FULL_66_9]|nr:MAG: hypothetical protein A2506_00015 [Elusimicrobia bacterium RIFOXYD12_FULL_66_9]
MKILLISTTIPGGEQAVPDLGLGHIATHLRKGGHTVFLKDFSVERRDLDAFERYLKDEKFDVVGLKMFSGGLADGRKVTDRIKRALPAAKIIIGGPHPSCAPEHTLEYFADADYACYGEGELCLRALADQLQAGKLDLPAIPSLAFRETEPDGKTTVRINHAVQPEDLDELGWPAWDLIPPKRYASRQTINILPKEEVIAPIIASRGCAYACTFCTGHTITGKGVRFRSPDSLLDEIEMLIRDHGIQEFQIMDDNFTFKKSFVFDFCEKMKKRGIKIPWSCPYGIRVMSVTPEMIKAMWDAGCYYVALGIESGSDRILDKMNKKLRSGVVSERVQIIKDHSGMNVMGFFIIGYPTETVEEVEHTIEFAANLPLDFASFTTLRLTPGMGILDEVKAEGWTDFSWETIDTFKLSYHPTTISREKLNELRKKAYRRFYASPRRIMNILKSATSRRNLTVLAHLSWRRLFPS